MKLILSQAAYTHKMTYGTMTLASSRIPEKHHFYLRHLHSLWCTRLFLHRSARHHKLVLLQNKCKKRQRTSKDSLKRCNADTFSQLVSHCTWSNEDYATVQLLLSAAFHCSSNLRNLQIALLLPSLLFFLDITTFMVYYFKFLKRNWYYWLHWKPVWFWSTSSSSASLLHRVLE